LRLAKRIQSAHNRKSRLSMQVARGSNRSSAVESPNGSSSHQPSPANGSIHDEGEDDGEDGEDTDLDLWADEFEKELV
jgi:hypothetical protein